MFLLAWYCEYSVNRGVTLVLLLCQVQSTPCIASVGLGKNLFLNFSSTAKICLDYSQQLSSWEKVLLVFPKIVSKSDNSLLHIINNTFFSPCLFYRQLPLLASRVSESVSTNNFMWNNSLISGKQNTRMPSNKTTSAGYIVVNWLSHLKQIF